MAWSRQTIVEKVTKVNKAFVENFEEGIEENKTAAAAANTLATTALERNVPSGGTTGQVLEKESNTNYKTKWGTTSGVISGGTAGQALARKGATETEWKTFPSTGEVETIANTAANKTALESALAVAINNVTTSGI